MQPQWKDETKRQGTRDNFTRHSQKVRIKATKTSVLHEIFQKSENLDFQNNATTKNTAFQKRAFRTRHFPKNNKRDIRKNEIDFQNECFTGDIRKKVSRLL